MAALAFPQTDDRPSVDLTPQQIIISFLLFCLARAGAKPTTHQHQLEFERPGTPEAKWVSALQNLFLEGGDIPDLPHASEICPNIDQILRALVGPNKSRTNLVVVPSPAIRRLFLDAFELHRTAVERDSLLKLQHDVNVLQAHGLSQDKAKHVYFLSGRDVELSLEAISWARYALASCTPEQIAKLQWLINGGVAGRKRIVRLRFAMQRILPYGPYDYPEFGRLVRCLSVALTSDKLVRQVRVIQSAEQANIQLEVLP